MLSRVNATARNGIALLLVVRNVGGVDTGGLVGRALLVGDGLDVEGNVGCRSDTACARPGEGGLYFVRSPGTTE